LTDLALSAFDDFLEPCSALADLALSALSDFTETCSALADLALSALGVFTETWSAFADFVLFTELRSTFGAFLPDFLPDLTLLERLPSFVFGTIFGDLKEGGSKSDEERPNSSIKSSNVSISKSIDIENPDGAGLTGLKVGAGVTGFIVGAGVGEVTVGVPVTGIAVGAPVGIAEGVPVTGLAVGVSVTGLAVGAPVGDAVGISGTAGHTFLGGAVTEV
jgi:hypothetical protein